MKNAIRLVLLYTILDEPVNSCLTMVSKPEVLFFISASKVFQLFLYVLSPKHVTNIGHSYLQLY